MAVKSGEERLKEMEAEMALFEQEVLGGPMPVSGNPPVLEAVPVALPLPAVVRPIIGTNTYRQVQQTLEARAATFVGSPPPTFVGPATVATDLEGCGHPAACLCFIPPVRPPMMRPAFVPHILQRPILILFLGSVAGQRLQMMRAPAVAPPLPRPPPPPPMVLPPPSQGPTAQLAPQPIQHMAAAPQVPEMVSMVTDPSTVQGPLPPIKPTPSIIQAAPTDSETKSNGGASGTHSRTARCSAGQEGRGGRHQRGQGPQQAGARAPPHGEFQWFSAEVHRGCCGGQKEREGGESEEGIRTAAGISWEDPSLLDWETDDFRIFCGDLGNEVNDDILARAFSRYPSFLKAKVVRDKRTGKTKGYGFVSFKDPNDYVRAMREMNGQCVRRRAQVAASASECLILLVSAGKYVGSRPIKLRKSMWKDRNMDVVRKKQKEKKKLGLR
ncbi:unnamed protein product [Tetraodon nigroviridis]|uniref:RNA-binding protein 42 n=1 Tax=Tetraodon nigroviridis TaxID=99883 RepID=Q4S9B3_TETNG|nr:unnamed protein product [Tetraodon nigroviridis]